MVADRSLLLNRSALVRFQYIVIAAIARRLMEEALYEMQFIPDVFRCIHLLKISEKLKSIELIHNKYYDSDDGVWNFFDIVNIVIVENKTYIRTIVYACVVVQ
jgi:hypothetical protein